VATATVVRLRRAPAASAAFGSLMGFKLTMRFRLTTLIAVLTLALAAAPAALAGGSGSLSPPGGTTATGPAERALVKSLATGMRQAGAYSGADVVDLTTGATLYSHNASTPRLPASVQKLYTTTTALSLYGPSARLTTSLLGIGSTRGSTFTGTLYLRGGGDPTFGSASFDQSHYDTGSSVQQLVAKLRTAGIDAVAGRLVADGSWFDADKGTPATGNRPSIDVEGELAGLDYNRGWANADGTVYYKNPTLEAGLQLRAAMRAAQISLPRGLPVSRGRTPAAATTLASVTSPTISQLIALTNTPSDNFFAETLLKDLGAKFGSGGTTADGAAVVRTQVASSFDVDPRFDDGSGLSRYDRTTPAQVIALLSTMADNVPFTSSLAVAGRTGTLADEMNGTYAQGRCRGKTGTLHDVSNVVGYCTAQDGHTIAYALLMNGIVPDYAHPIQDRMQLAIARYDG
jgi:D-alanyl-D-alanine carboxypeptidase/D-alanyl-D-alanine-endopeptidase (penicillin-binding protein 4)